MNVKGDAIIGEDNNNLLIINSSIHTNSNFISTNGNFTTTNGNFTTTNGNITTTNGTIETSNIITNNINIKGEKYLPFISILFLYILLVNLIGLVPYSFTVTSHLIITFTLSFSIFIGINIICINIYKSEMLSLFIPSNTSFGLALLLVPIEFVSYIFKPISLGVRLFANLMAGHTLLKVIVGFSWSMLLIENILSFFHLVPLLILVVFENKGLINLYSSLSRSTY